MKLYHHFILIIGAMITLLIGAAMIVCACGLFQSFTLVPQADGESFFSWRRITVICAGAFLVLFGGYTLLFPAKLRYNKKDFIVQKGEKGDLLFSVKTLESLVRECVDMHKEIEAKTLRIVPGKDGIAVRLRVVMASNISMPLVQDSLANQIKQYVTASSGVQVKSVNVAVVGVAEKAGGSASPYTVSKEEVQAEAPREEAPEEKKLPHLRLFDKEEEPAVVPVAAQAQEAAEALVGQAAEETAAKAEEVLNGAADAAEAAAGDAVQTAEEIGDVVQDAAEKICEAGETAVEQAADAAETVEKVIDGTEEQNG